MIDAKRQLYARLQAQEALLAFLFMEMFHDTPDEVVKHLGDECNKWMKSVKVVSQEDSDPQEIDDAMLIYGDATLMVEKFFERCRKQLAASRDR